MRRAYRQAGDKGERNRFIFRIFRLTQHYTCRSLASKNYKHFFKEDIFLYYITSATLKNMKPFLIKGFEIDISRYAKALIKSSIWLVCVFACGSLPFLLMKFIQAFKIAEANEKLKLFDHDLFLPFLCCAIIGEISFEAFLCKIKFSKYTYMFFAFSSGAIIAIVCIVYLVMFFKEPTTMVELPASWIIQTFVVSYTSIYSFSIKALMYIDESKK